MHYKVNRQHKPERTLYKLISSCYICSIAESIIFQPEIDYRERIASVALSLEGAPAIRYKKGRPDLGKSPEDGFDCSGFVTFVLNQAGVIVPDYVDISNKRRPIRHANEYWDHFGVAVHHGLQQKGDLIFFTRNGFFPGHIGIVLDPSRYIHSPGQDDEVVNIEPIRRYGIDFQRPDGAPRTIFNTNITGYKSPTIPFGSDDYRYLQRCI